MYRIPRNPGFIGSLPWGPLSIFFGVLVGINWWAVEHYSPAPGFYMPWDWLIWFSRHKSGPAIWLAKIAGWGIGSLFIAMACARIASAIRLRRMAARGEDIHGSARFATERDIRKAGLLDKQQGLIIGGFEIGNQIRYLRHTGPESFIVIAPPRSGKGISIVVPNLLEHPANMVVNDIKGELWHMTAGFRQKELGHRVLNFAPTEEASCGYNPFAEVRLHTKHEVPDVQNIMNIMIRTTEITAHNKHWYDTAESLGIGIALHQLYIMDGLGLTASPIDIFNGLTPIGMKLRDYLSMSLTYEHDPDLTEGWLDSNGQPTPTHPEVRRHFQMQLDRSDDEFGSVASTLSTAFLVFTDPGVQRATSRSDFKMRDLMDNSKPITLYVSVPPSDQDRLQPLRRLLFTQIVQRNTEKVNFLSPSVDPKDRLLLLIDEAGSLGYMKVLANSIAYLPGYNIQAYLIFHSIGQILENYGHHNSVLGSTHVKIAFSPNTTDTAVYLSDMTGKTTIMRTNMSFSGQKNSMWGARSVTQQIAYEARPLLTPDEVMRMSAIQVERDYYGPGLDRIGRPGQMLIFMAGQPPILGTQTIYLWDQELVRRSKIPAPAPEVQIATVP